MTEMINSDDSLLQNLTNFNYSISTPAATTTTNTLNESSTIDANPTDVPYTPYNLRPETYIIPILFAIIFLVGVIGNGTLVVVFLRHRAMRNVPNT